MSLPLTPDILRAAYAYLCETPPFSRWNMPDSEDVAFRVIRDPALRGWYNHIKGRHTIGISRGSIGHTINVVATMAHEMIHLYQREAGIATRGAQHNAAFRKLSDRVCKFHGFDPKLF